MSTTWRTLAGQRHARKKPTLFNIPSDVGFVDALARGILDDTAADPLALAALTVLLPTRRACRSLREAFLRLSGGKPLLLPRLVPLSEMDEEETLFQSFAITDGVADIPPPISGLKRQLMLARLIGAREGSAPEQAVVLAQELARFLDEVQTEGVSFANLAKLPPERFAQHWQETITFLGVLTEAWPAILAQDSALDPAEHRNRVFAAQAAAWRRAAPSPIIAAGSTGSIPATANVLSVIARLPEGCVVLPGLDEMLDDESWAAVDETHPQHGLKQLLAHLDADRADVTPWPVDTAPGTRATFLREMMRPAATTERWRTLPTIDPSATAGLTQLDCATPREEAESVALIMREALEKPGRTCALVTPDRALGERVAAELKRWDIDIDDSAGRPLAQTPPGAFLRLTAAMVADDFAPVATLAACKHPLAAAGRDAAEFRSLTRRAEREILRGPRPPAGLNGLAVLAQGKRAAISWLALLGSTCGAFAGLMKQDKVSLSKLLNAHMEAAEALAATNDLPGPARLWAEDAGEAAARFAAELSQYADTLEPISPAAYPAFLEALMQGVVVRPRFGKHPRLHILGPLEARLQRFDVLVLSGLNEGTWPATARPYPWMSRPMRAAFGLPSPERRIGQAAHDIVQAMSAPVVYLTRARKVEGTPTVPSRWLMRLERVCAAGNLPLAVHASLSTWTRALTQPTAFQTITPPAPRPPVAARPRRLSVTEIERWMRDPYSIYVRHVLKLVPLDPLEQEAGAADYGSLIHKALQDFVQAYPSGALPANALQELLAYGSAAFAEVAARPGVTAFWGPRFERIAAWFVAVETPRREGLAKSFAEVKGELSITTSGGAFTLVAKADRIDRRRDGTLAIIDYKTGTPPHENEVINGFAPQLPLEAAMLARAGFPGVLPGPVTELAFWQVHGRGAGGEEKLLKASPAQLAAEAFVHLRELVEKFDDPATPYEAQPNPAHAPKYSDYDHLARVKEWAAGAEDGE